MTQQQGLFGAFVLNSIGKPMARCHLCDQGRGRGQGAGVEGAVPESSRA